MKNNQDYSNGQKQYEQSGDMLTYFFKNGKIKAQGISVHGVMKGEWKFYRETGQLWQIGNFSDGQKHGCWIRYNRKDELEYDETFVMGKQVKK